MTAGLTQCISAITIPNGQFENCTFVVAAYQSGVSVGQFSPNPTPPSYTLGGMSNLDNNGATTSAIEFLLDYSNTDYPPPYYFLYASEAGHIWLNSITPATEGNQFTSSNVTTQIHLEVQLDEYIVGLFYYPPQGYLYVATSDSSEIANLYWYSVIWSNSGPSLSYVGSNTSYTGNALLPLVSLTFFPAKTLTNYDCLLLGGISEATGVIFNAQNPSSTPTLYGYLAEYCQPMVYPSAVCNGPNGIYFATLSGSLNYQPYSGFNASLAPIWTVPSGQTILSMAYSPNPTPNTPGYYADGAIFIATAPSSPSDSSSGSIWILDVSNNTVGKSAQQDGTISGAPWAIIADANLNYMCATGSCGVFLGTPNAYNPQSAISENYMVVPNVVSSGVHHDWLSDLVTAAELAFGVVTDDPLAIGWALTGIVDQVATS